MRGKLLLYGDHAVVYCRPCLVAAINRYVTVTPTPKVGRESAFVAAARQLFAQKYGSVRFGFKITAFSRRYGLGSSAAVTAAVAKALFNLKNISVSNKQLFDFCYQVIKKVQGVGSGFDLAAAIYGGIIYFVSGGQIIEKLSVKQLPLVTGYSGAKADTVAMIKKAKINADFLEQSEKIVSAARKALLKQDWPLAGKLMSANQKILQSIGVSTPKLNRLVAAAAAAGSWGAKLAGAGGGDCMIALVTPARRLAVEQAIRQAGGQVLRVKLAL